MAAAVLRIQEFVLTAQGVKCCNKGFSVIGTRYAIDLPVLCMTLFPLILMQALVTVLFCVSLLVY